MSNLNKINTNSQISQNLLKESEKLELYNQWIYDITNKTKVKYTFYELQTIKEMAIQKQNNSLLKAIEKQINTLNKSLISNSPNIQLTRLQKMKIEDYQHSKQKNIIELNKIQNENSFELNDLTNSLNSIQTIVNIAQKMGYNTKNITLDKALYLKTQINELLNNTLNK